MQRTARELSHRVMRPKKLPRRLLRLCVSDPPAELALVNLVHAVLQYCGLALHGTVMGVMRHVC